jgi:hypothetical protein
MMFDSFDVLVALVTMAACTVTYVLLELNERSERT